MSEPRLVTAHDIALSRMREPKGGGVAGAIRRMMEYQTHLRDAMEEKARGEWVVEEAPE